MQVPTRWGSQLNGNSSGLAIALTNVRGVPTRWGSQLNGNGGLLPRCRRASYPGPHSLGIPIEWKLALNVIYITTIAIRVPTRWGSQLNGNTVMMLKPIMNCRSSPHSLGIPIEWKQQGEAHQGQAANGQSPHSLGIPIEWKRSLVPHQPLSHRMSPLAGDPN